MGDQPNQRALANKVAAVCDLRGIVLSRNIPNRPPGARARLRALITGLQMRTVGRPLRNAWVEMQADCALQYPSFPASSRTLRVNNVNDIDTSHLIATLAPDVILVSGTNLVGKKLIAACGVVPILNLHTGISPYVKGGPNCTNWCLAEQLFHLIGNTVMWLDAGIDSGDLMATERTPLTFDETLGELHRRVIGHAHDLLVRSIGEFASGRRLPRVPQNQIGHGRTFYTKDWNGRAILRARRNFERHYSARLIDNPAFGDTLTRVRLVTLCS
jgi:methionyl-tRNA formyltransferase